MDVNGRKKRALGIIRDVPISLDGLCTTKINLQVSDATTYKVILGNDWLVKTRAIVDLSREHMLVYDKRTDQVIKHPMKVFKEPEPIVIPGDEEFEEQEILEQAVYYKRDDTPEAIQQRLYAGNFNDVLFEPQTNREKNETRKLESLEEITDEQQNELSDLLDGKRHLFATEITDLGSTNIVEHTIYTPNTNPVKHNLRRYGLEQNEFMKEEIQKMLEAGIIRPTQSPWNSPPVIVAKKNGKLRFCIDYRKLNDVTIKDAYPLPNITETLDSFHGARYFSTLDLASGYWQVAIAEEDKPKTAFKTKFGHFEFNKMPFGLTNAPATFQRLMDRILRNEIEEFVQVYLDDIIIYSKSWEEHLGHIQIILERLEEAGLKLGRDKCFFGKTELEFLGHIITREGIKPNPDKVAKVKNWPIPTDKTKVRGFLGLVGYYRRFIKNFSDIAKPLYNVSGSTRIFGWGEPQQQAFDKLKNELINHVVMKYPDFTKPFIVSTDASKIALGAVLSQEDENGQERPIAFASKTLVDAQTRYSATELELMAIWYALTQVFKQYLLGQRFIIVTDHKAIKGLLESDNGSDRIQKWRLDLQPYRKGIIRVDYKPGKQHNNVDALSRKLDEKIRQRSKGPASPETAQEN